MESIFHIGLIKTGSTFLQREVFSKISSNFCYLDSKSFLNQREKFVLSNKPLFISNENLSGHPFLYSSEGLSYFEQFKNSLRNIKGRFNNPKIIIGFREPSSFIYSAYQQYLKEWGTLKWTEFLNKLDESFYNDFYFSKYVQHLLNEFSENQVMIYLFEDLKSNPKFVLSEILGFLGTEKRVLNSINTNIRTNVSIPPGYESILIKLNRFSASLYKYTGFRLALRIGNFGINPTKFVQDFLPKSKIVKDKSRNFADLENFYNDDWIKTKNLIYSLSKQPKKSRTENFSDFNE